MVSSSFILYNYHHKGAKYLRWTQQSKTNNGFSVFLTRFYIPIPKGVSIPPFLMHPNLVAALNALYYQHVYINLQRSMLTKGLSNVWKRTLQTNSAFCFSQKSQQIIDRIKLGLGHPEITQIGQFSWTKNSAGLYNLKYKFHPLLNHAPLYGFSATGLDSGFGNQIDTRLAGFFVQGINPKDLEKNLAFSLTVQNFESVPHLLLELFHQGAQIKEANKLAAFAWPHPEREQGTVIGSGYFSAIYL